MPLSATDAVTPAIEHAKKQLFQPFRFGQWMRLAVVGFLTGEISSGGSCNSPTSFRNSRGGGTPDAEAVFHKATIFWHEHTALIAGLITGLIIFLFLLGILFAYLNSRMRFVLFDSIIARECRIREYWSRNRETAWRLFVWQLLFGLCSLMASVIFIGVPVGIAWAAGWFRKPGDHVGALVLGGVFVFCIFVVLAICTSLIRVFTKDFVVPYMAVEGLTVMDAWRRVWAAMKQEKGSYTGYIGMKIVLSIASGIIFGILGLIVIFIIAIPFVILGVMVGVMAAGAGLAWNAFTITLTVVAGFIGFLAIMFIVAFISAPVVVFFPAYSIHFLASRYPKLDALLHPPPPVPPTPPTPVIPPQMPPPFFPPEPDPMGS